MEKLLFWWYSVVINQTHHIVSQRKMLATCLNDKSFFLLKQCPNQKAVGFYDKYVLHYANHSIFGYD